ncbi:SIS domain-containing protein [soil metagenome]
MMDATDTLSVNHEFLTDLADLPGSYDGPDGLRTEPYGLLAFGEAASLPSVLRSWVDAPLVLSGTQFILSGGFDYGDAAPLKVGTELAGAEVVTLGHGLHEPSLFVGPDSLSFYTYASYLAYATGHADDLAAANQAMLELAAVLRPEVETARNPAKTLAWNLWNRVPLLVASKTQAGLTDLVQRVLARTGKTLAITTGEHPLETLAGAFESRHGLGDDVVGLILGDEDEETALAVELLDTRVAQTERLALPFGGVGVAPKDAGAHALVLWYASMWTASYLALLHGLEPADTDIYSALRDAVPQKSEEFLLEDVYTDSEEMV